MTPDHLIAWAAGLFEGEGYAGVVFNKNLGPRPGPKAQSPPRPVLALAMTDEDVVRRFHEIIGVGYVRESTTRAGRPLWTWRAGSKPDVRDAVELLIEYAGDRRRAQLANVLSECEPRDGWTIRRERYGPTGRA